MLCFQDWIAYSNKPSNRKKDLISLYIFFLVKSYHLSYSYLFLKNYSLQLLGVYILIDLILM